MIWKLKDINSDITIEEIRNFAEYQFCDMGDGDAAVYIDSGCLPEELKEYAVINPWIDDSGRFPLTTLEAENLYGKSTVQNFVLKATGYLQKHRLIAWTQVTDGNKDCWTIGLFRDNDDETGKISYHTEKTVREGGNCDSLCESGSEEEAWKTFNDYVKLHDSKKEAV